MFHRFFITGNVQGVGFRYFVLSKAKSLGLRGFVRNLSRGVEIVINDPDFMEKLKDLPYDISIADATKSDYDSKEEFDGFTVLRD
jgi:acylphosphatase